MNINFFANLFKVSRLLGKSGHSFLVTTRKKSRDFLVITVTESFYLAMYFTFLVFIVGLAASLKWRYKDQLVSGFVRNNLPAVGNPSNQITWETFEHIGSKELTPQQRGPLSLLVDSPFVERIDIYNDSLIIKPRTPWEKLKGQRYIGFYTPSPSPHAHSALNISSATPNLSHLPLGGEASRQLGPSSVLASSARLYVPARGFVEFSPLAHTLPRLHPLHPLPPEGLGEVPSPLHRMHGMHDHALRGRVSQASQVSAIPSDEFGVSIEGRSSNSLVPIPTFEDSAGLTESFNVGSYLLGTRPTSIVRISDQGTLEAAADHSHGLRGVSGSAHRKVGVFSLSPIKKWVYQFYGQLDEIPYKLGSTKLLPDNLAVIESAKLLIDNSRREEEPTADKLVQRNTEPVQRVGDRAPSGIPCLPSGGTGGTGCTTGGCGGPCPPSHGTPSSRVSSKRDLSRFQLPTPPDITHVRATPASLQMRASKLSKRWMREVGPIPGYANTLIGVKSMDPFGQELQRAGILSPQNLESSFGLGVRRDGGQSPPQPVQRLGALGLREGSLPYPMAPTTSSTARGRHRARAFEGMQGPASGAKRQAFAKEALLLLGSDGLVGQLNQDWEPLPLLLNELNSTEVIIAVEEGIKALEMGWEEVLALLSDSVSEVLHAIKPSPTRLMSGYSYPDSTRTKLLRDLTYWAIRYGFDVHNAAATLLLAEKEVLLPASLSLPLAHSAAQDSVGAKRRTDRQMTQLPLVEIDYRPVSLSGLTCLRDMLFGLKIESFESELDDIPMLETTYQGPAVARDKITNDLVGIGREELAAWVAKAIHGYGRGATSGAFVDPEATLPFRQSNRLGKKEVLRGEPLVHEKVLAAVRPRISIDTEIRRDQTEESDNSIELASLSLQPMKSNKIAPEQFLTGSGSKLKEPSQVVALERGDEAPLYPLEIVLTKAAPLFEEEQEVLSLEPDEWRNIFKGVVIQAIENKANLDKIEVLLPSIAVVHRGPGRQLEGENRAGLSGLGNSMGWGAEPPTTPGRASHAKQHSSFENQLQKGDLVYQQDRHLGQHTGSPGKADELARVLTSQEYANLAILIAQSKRFVGECNYWPITDLASHASRASLASRRVGGGSLPPAPDARDAREARDARPAEVLQKFMNDQGAGTATPRLLCHYLPLSQVAIPESSTKQPISAGNYQKRLTSFTARYPFNRHPRSSSASSSFRPTEQRIAVWPVVQSKQQMFYQLWEPVTANSWMMFYKLCFAFWIQEMGKDFYKRYGKEIILYALNLLMALGFDAQGIIEDLGLEESPIRVITNGKRRFGDIAGIDSILPELGEIVWFLRSSGRGGQVPKGILLVGPPGTGKTFVVQAIAGEAKVPVLVQSASSLTDSGQKQSGSQKLRDLFDRARQLSPCILFMDEIDTLGVSRPHVIGNTMGADELLESIEGGGSQQEDSTSLPGAARGLGQLNDATPELNPYLSFPPSPRASSESMLDGDEDDRPRDEAPVFREGDGDPQDSPGLDPSVIEVIESHNEERRTRQERLALLMQFLMEMDGLRALHGVVVIGATNRPAVLDPAFTRPGRFERILCLQLPGKQKRVEILKLYSKNLGFANVTPNVNRLAGGAWDYLANRTAGWSAAHLSAAMNQSAIRAIIQETAHTIETVEHGISAIARRSFQASSDQSSHALASKVEATVNGLLNPDRPFLTVFQQSSDSVTGGSLGWRRGLTAVASLASRREAPDASRASGAGGEGTSPQPLRAARDAREARGEDHWSANLSVKLSRTSTGLHRQGIGLAGNRGFDGMGGSMGPLSIARWAYYQAGKAVLQTALPLHPPAAFFSLRPQPFVKSSSDLAKQVASAYQQGSLEPHRRVVLETRLIGLYAGKASEMLALSAYACTGERGSMGWGAEPPTTRPTDRLASLASRREARDARGARDARDARDARRGNAALFESLPSRQKQSQGTSISQSDLGIEELTFAGVVANVMITSWYLYSKRVALQRLNLSTITRNTEEIDDPVLLDLFRHLEEDQEHQVERATRHSQRFQQWSPPSWWQTQVMAEAALVEPGYSEWYRIYIPDPEETERNIDWVPPEDHYHAATANQLRNVAKKARKRVTKSTLSQALTSTNRAIRHRSMGSLTAITWNDLYLINRDYIYHGLITSCFQKAFLLLDKRRELVDFLSDDLIRYDLLRQYDIEQICSNFGLDERPFTETPGGTHPSDGTPNRSAIRRPRPAVGGIGVREGSLPQPHGPHSQTSVKPVRPCEDLGGIGSLKGLGGKGVLGIRCRGGGNLPPTPSGGKGCKDEMNRQFDASISADRKLSSFENYPQMSQPLQHLSHVVEANWGSPSRRRISRFIDFDFVKPCYLKRVS